jgi:hypothetical protein
MSGPYKYVTPTPTRYVTPTPSKYVTPTPIRVTPTIAPSTLSFYLKTTDNITAYPGQATNVVAGCNVGDIAISAGMESYGGSLNKWKTIRTTPSTSTDMNGFLVTMLNEDTISHTFTITTKCLKK